MSKSFSATVEPENGYIVSTVTGTFDMQTAKEIILQAFDAAHNHRKEKILYDCRQMDGAFSTMQRYDIGMLFSVTIQEYSLESKQPPNLIVLLVDRRITASGRFAETVARNRGVPMIVVESIEEAYDVLGITPINDQQ